MLCIYVTRFAKKGSYTCTVSGLTFHYHSTDTTIDQQFMLVLLPNLQRSAFTEASFMGLSGSTDARVVCKCLQLTQPGRQRITTGLAGETGHQCSYILRRVELKTA